MAIGFRCVCFALAFLSAKASWGAPIVIDHRHTDIAALTATQIARAKTLLHIAYGHTSHGSQLTDGMTGLVDFANNGGRGLSLPSNIFVWNDGGAGGALDLHDYAMENDVGYYPDWVNSTRAYLNDPANANVNVIVWSWCGQMDDKYSSGTLNSEYLQPMAALESEYPNVVFVYMTGHVDIWDDAANKAACQVIRTWCASGNRVLYDFNDIEHYNPDGTYFPYVGDDCSTYNSAGGTPTGNWATQWQNTHVEGVDWYQCGSAHSEPLNANLKAYAAWALWSRIAERMAGTSFSLALSPTGRVHSATASHGQFYVAANTAWTATDNRPWITIVAGAAGSGNGTVVYRVDANNSGAARSGAITVTGGGLTRVGLVHQSEGDLFEPDNTISAAKAIGNTQVQNRSIHAAGNVDWVKFVVGGIGARNLVLETAGAEGDTQLWLYKGSNGAQLGYDDNSGAGNFSRLVVAALSPGTHLIKIQEYGNNGTIPAYTLRANWATRYGPDAYEPDNTAGAAKVLANGQTQVRNIHAAGNVDWAKFTVGGRGARNVVLETAGSSGDTQLWLYRGNGAPAGYDNDSGAGNFSRLAVAALAPGTYFIKIQENGNNGEIPGYTLRATWVSP